VAPQPSSVGGVEPVVRRGASRWAWFGAGWASVGIGGVGIVVPGLPTTVFFIMAAACFSRSSPRFERWVLDLPRIGPMVRDHRDGLGMPRRAKGFAIGTIVVVSGISAVLTASAPVVRALILVLAAIGVAYITWRVPTRERVLAQRTPSTATAAGQAWSPPR
jgi:uncharacterized membrane protein YbaN (DUF454 family)